MVGIEKTLSLYLKRSYHTCIILYIDFNLFNEPLVEPHVNVVILR